MAYSPIGWENTPSTNTPITAENLNHMDEGILNANESIEKLSKHPKIYFGTAEWNSNYKFVEVSISNLDINSVSSGDIFIGTFDRDAVLEVNGTGVINLRINTAISSAFINVDSNIEISANKSISFILTKNGAVLLSNIHDISSIDSEIDTLNNDINSITSKLNILTNDKNNLQAEDRAIYGTLEYSADTHTLNLITNYKDNNYIPYICYGYTDTQIDIESDTVLLINGQQISTDGAVIQSCTIYANCTARIVVSRSQGTTTFLITETSARNKWGASIDYEVSELKSDLGDISTILDTINGEVI